MEKVVHGVETHWLFNKKKLGAVVSKEGHAMTVLWDMKGLYTDDFCEKDTTVNSSYYCQLIRQNSPYLLNNPCTHVKLLFDEWRPK